MKLLTYPKEVTPKLSLVVTKARQLGNYTIPDRRLTMMKTRAQGSSTANVAAFNRALQRPLGKEGA